MEYKRPLPFSEVCFVEVDDVEALMLAWRAKIITPRLVHVSFLLGIWRYFSSSRYARARIVLSINSLIRNAGQKILSSVKLLPTPMD